MIENCNRGLRREDYGKKVVTGPNPFIKIVCCKVLKLTSFRLTSRIESNQRLSFTRDFILQLAIGCHMGDLFNKNVILAFRELSIHAGDLITADVLVLREEYIFSIWRLV